MYHFYKLQKFTIFLLYQNHDTIFIRDPKETPSKKNVIKFTKKDFTYEHLILKWIIIMSIAELFSYNTASRRIICTCKRLWEAKWCCSACCRCSKQAGTCWCGCRYASKRKSCTCRGWLRNARTSSTCCRSSKWYALTQIIQKSIST